jgi:hypothetical protein
MTRQVQESVYLRYGHPFRTVHDLYDFIACPNLSLFDHPEVKARTSVGHQQRRHLRIVHSNADAIAGHPRLRDFKESSPNSVAISDANVIIRKALDGQILAELSIDKVSPPEIFLPVSIGLELIHHHSAMFASVSGEIALSIAVDIETACHDPIGHRCLPYGGMDKLSLPFDVARKSHIHGDE